MGNLINRGMNTTAPQMQQVQGENIPQAQGGGINPASIQRMLKNPQVREQIRQTYRAFNGDTNALMQNLIHSNPKLRNNPMLNMIMQSQNNPNGILGAFGVNQQDFVDIINGK